MAGVSATRNSSQSRNHLLAAMLQSLKRQKLIENGRNKIVIRNRKGIERMAGGSYGTPEKEYRRLIG
jgi:hypothetical protein